MPDPNVTERETHSYHLFLVCPCGVRGTPTGSTRDMDHAYHLARSLAGWRVDRGHPERTLCRKCHNALYSPLRRFRETRPGFVTGDITPGPPGPPRGTPERKKWLANRWHGDPLHPELGSEKDLDSPEDVVE